MEPRLNEGTSMKVKNRSLDLLVLLLLLVAAATTKLRARHSTIKGDYRMEA